MHLLYAILSVIALSFHAHRKKSLSFPSGILCASFLGLITFIQTWNYFTAILLAFYLSSSRLSKVKIEEKENIEEGCIKGSNRNGVQVICNSLPAVVMLCSVYYLGIPTQCINNNPIALRLLYMYLAHYACCNGDTWASELGVLSAKLPILITTLETVPKGTNGGISLLGTFASLVGGLTIGFIGWSSFPLEESHCVLPRHLGPKMIVIGGLSGLLGSMLDSLLGATLQRTIYNKELKKVVRKWDPDNSKALVYRGRDVLTNEGVNLISSSLVTILVGLVVS